MQTKIDQHFKVKVWRAETEAQTEKVNKVKSIANITKQVESLSIGEVSFQTSNIKNSFKTQKNKEKSSMKTQKHKNIQCKERKTVEVNLKKMIKDAKLSERLSNHHVGGGLGKQKRYNRLIAAGKESRGQNFKKKSMRKTEYYLDSKSSDRTRDDSVDKARSEKFRNRDMIEPQGFMEGTVKHQIPDEFIEAVNNVAESIEDKTFELGSDTMGLFERFIDAIKSLSRGKVDVAFDTSSLANMMPSMSTAMWIAWLVVSIYIGYRAIKSRSLIRIFSAVTGLLIYITPVVATPARKAMHDIINWFNSLLSGEEINEHGVSSCIIDSAMAFVYYTHFKAAAARDTGGKLFTNFVERISKMKKNYEGLEFSFSFFLKIMQEFLDWISRTFGTRRYCVAFDNRPEVTMYAEKVNTVVESYVRGKTINSEAADEIIGVYIEGKKLVKDLPGSVEYADSRKLLNAAISEITPWVLKVRRSNVYNNGPRIEPVGVFLTGPSGVGKTTALVPLILGVTSRVLPDDKIEAFRHNHNDFIYNRISENEYFDAYTGQFNCIFDDLGQMRDVAGVHDNPYMEAIRMINSHNMDLHAAHLDDKGNMNFKSRIVWATSNVAKFNLQSIISNEALTRRFRCSYMVVPKVGYREDDSQPDPWKMRLKKNVVIHEFEHLEFMNYDVLNGKVVGPQRYTLEEVIEQIVTVYKETDKFGTALLNKHQVFKEKYISMRPTGNITVEDDDEPVLIRKSRDLEKRDIVPQMLDDGDPKIKEFLNDFRWKHGPGSLGQLGDIANFGATKCSIESACDIYGLKHRTNYRRTTPRANAHGLESLMEQSYSEVWEESPDQTLPPFHKFANVILEYKEKIADKYAESPSFKETFAGLISFRNVLAIAGLVVGAMALNKFIKSFEKKDEIVPASDTFIIGSDNSSVVENSSLRSNRKPPETRPKGEKFKKGRFIRGHGKGHRQLRGHKIEPQLAYDSNCDEILLKVFKNNMYAIRGQDQTSNMGYVTFIAGHDAIAPAHFMEKYCKLMHLGLIDEDFTVVLTRGSEPTTTFTVCFADIEMFYPDEWEDQDICICRFPNTLPNAPDIRKYFLEEDDFKHVDNKFTGKLCLPLGDGHCQIHTTNMYASSNIKYTEYVVTHMFAYAIPTREGHCGAMCAVSNPITGPRKLIGIHTAGKKDGGVGYSIKVSKEMIDTYYKFYDERDIIDQPFLFSKNTTDKTITPQGFHELYEAPKPNVPVETKIIPSPLQDTFSPHVCEPAKLRTFINHEGEKVDPWAIARSNYRRDVPYANADILRQCTISYLRVMMRQSNNDVNWGPKVFTFEEAVRGIPGIPNCEAIPRGTSPGYPWVLNVPKGHKGKTHFFGKEDEFDFSSIDCGVLKKRVKDIIANAKNGIRLEHIYMDFLKDERRKKKKALAGESRLVSASPVDLLIAFRMYFLDFVRWYMNNRMHNGSAVGINPFSEEWDALYRFLQSEADVRHMIAGDFKSYDGCLFRQVQLEFLWLVNKWYNDGNDRVREILFEEVCNSRHIYQDIVYEWPGSNPSGCFVTTILNSCCNNIILRYVGLLSYSNIEHNRMNLPYVKMPQHTVSSVLNSIEQCTRIITFGDDNLISVKNTSIQKWFNQNTLTENFKHIGFTYTPEDKSTEDVKPFRYIWEVSFLKRKFRHSVRAGRVIAPLDLDVVLEMSQWTTRSDRNYDNVKTNVDTALKELSAHGDAIWNHWYPKISGASRDHLDYIPQYHDRLSALAAQLSRDETGM